MSAKGRNNGQQRSLMKPLLYWRYVRYSTSTFDPTHVEKASKWVGMLYITNGVSPTRWNHLPPHFTLVATLDMP